MKYLVLLLLTGCVAVPPFPPAGPAQTTAPQVNNPNCLASCTVGTPAPAPAPEAADPKP